MSGLRLTTRPPSFQTFEVTGVADDSPAREDGMLDGDVITAIDGRTNTVLTLAEVQTSFQRAGELRRLSIQRGDKTINVELHLRRLI